MNAMKKLFALAASAMLVGASVGPAWSAGHDEPGTPGDANCKGQTMAYLNQAAGDLDPAVHGIGNLARAAELTTQELHEVVDTYCATVEEPEPSTP
jgi:hypothetical protein